MAKIINSMKKSFNIFFPKTIFLLIAGFFIVLAASQPGEAKPPKSTLETPASVKAQPVSEHQNDLRWQYGSSKIDGFSIERSTTPDSGFSQIAIIDPTAISFLDSGLASGKCYFYRMRAFKHAGNDTTYSYYSETVSATTPGAPVPGSFALDAASYSVGESNGTLSVTVRRVGGSDGIVSVDWRTQTFNGYGTADWQTDYTTVDPTTLTFADGETSKTVSVSIASDSEVEGDETFTVLLENPAGGATLDTVSSAVVTIVDDDTTNTDTTTDSGATTASPGSFAFDAASYSVGESGGMITVTVRRLGGSDGIVTVDWRTRTFKGYGTADWRTDYTTVDPTTLTFADGETTKTVSVSITSDSEAEEDETFTVLFENPAGGATLDTASSAVVTIIDDDEGSTSPAPSLGYLPVFPGAQGFGTETKAGRGGKIIKVTNLNDSGPGSLREALLTSGPRIVVFEVSGTITLQDAIHVRTPYLTLAGQTAPSPGITLKGAPLDIQAHNVLVQHIRVRTGDENPGNIPVDSLDSMQIRDNRDENVHNVVYDHVTASWGIDENMGIGKLENATVSNSIVSEGLNNSLKGKPHSKGILISDNTTNVSLIGNLIAHNKGRNGGNWKGATYGVALNNLLYNAGYVNYMIGDSYSSGPAYVSIIGNVAIGGADTPSGNYLVQIESNTTAGTEIYLKGNRTDGRLFNNKASFGVEVSSPPVWHPSLVVKDAGTVEASVLANAGARPADRDAVDERIVNEVKSRTGNIIDSQQQVGGWPTLRKNYRAFPIPSDPHGDADGDGYTNIEEVLHQMAAQVEGRS